MIPQKILKSSSSEMLFSTFWTLNRIVFMRIFTAIWRLFSVKNRFETTTVAIGVISFFHKLSDPRESINSRLLADVETEGIFSFFHKLSARECAICIL